MGKNNKVISNPNKAKAMIAANKNKSLEMLAVSSVTNPNNKNKIVSVDDLASEVSCNPQKPYQETRPTYPDYNPYQLLEEYQKNNPARFNDFTNWALGFHPQSFLRPEEFEDLQTLISLGVTDRPDSRGPWSAAKAIAMGYHGGWEREYCSALINLARYPQNAYNILGEIKAIEYVFGFKPQTVEIYSKKKKSQIISYSMTHNLWTKIALAGLPSEGDPNGNWAYQTTLAHYNKPRWEILDNKAPKGWDVVETSVPDNKKIMDFLSLEEGECVTAGDMR